MMQGRNLVQFPTITMIQGTPQLVGLYPGEERNDVMHLDYIRFHKDWTTSSNFRRQIEILEISEEWEEELKTEHDYRMDMLLRRHFRYHWLAFSRHLLERSGNDVRTLRIMGRMVSAEMIERLWDSGDKIELVIT